MPVGRRLLSLLLVAGFLATPALEDGHGDTPEPDDSRRSGYRRVSAVRGQNEKELRAKEIQVLLDQRAASVAARDRNAFLETVDPSAADFRTSQALWFDRIGSIPVSDYSLQLDLDESPELTRTKDRDRFGPSALVAAVEERYRVEGFDDRPVLGGLFFTFVVSEEGWRIASDGGVDDLGLYSARHPWDFEEVRTATSDHFAIVFHPGDEARADSFLGLAEEALPQVDRIWMQEWGRRVVVYLPSSLRELERILDVTHDLGPFVAVATASVDTDAGWEISAPRVVLHRENFLRHTRAVKRSIFAHELLHVASFSVTGPFMPTFVDEGFARLAESDQDRSLRGVFSRQTFEEGLPESVDFISGGSAGINRAYLKAFSAAAFFRERWGIDKLNELYKTIGAARIEPGTRRYHFDRAIRLVGEVSMEEFQAEWVKYVTGG